MLAFVVCSQQAAEKTRTTYILAKDEILTSCISICRGDFWIRNDWENQQLLGLDTWLKWLWECTGEVSVDGSHRCENTFSSCYHTLKVHHMLSVGAQPRVLAQLWEEHGYMGRGSRVGCRGKHSQQLLWHPAARVYVTHVRSHWSGDKPQEDDVDASVKQINLTSTLLFADQLQCRGLSTG